MTIAGGSPDLVRREVSGRLVVVTGASRGIGREVSRRLVSVGATVIGIARDADALREVSERALDAGLFVPLPGDLRDVEWAEQAGHEILDRWGTPEIVVSNAGHSIHRYLDEYSGRFHDVARTAGVNYLGAVALSLPLLQAMCDAGHGHFVLVSSTSVDLPMPGWSVYGASKQAMETWLAAVAPELAARGVATTSVHLPRVATAMSRPTAGRYPVPELSVGEAAGIICRILVSRPRFVVPWWARLGAGVQAVVPGAVQAFWQGVLRMGVRP